MAFFSTSTVRRWLPLVWATAPVLLLAVGVQITRTGIDLLVIAIASLALFAVERTVGDWLGELVGATVAGMIFAGVAVLAIWYFFFSSAGSAQTTQFFAAAEARGYSSAYVDTGTSDPNRGSRGSAASPDAGAGGSASSSGGSAASSDSSAGAVESRPEPERQEPARAPKDGGSAQQNSATSVLKWFWNPSKRPEPKPTSITLTVNPARVGAGLRTLLSAAVTTAGQPVAAGSVQFMVGDRSAGTIYLRDGAAETTFSSMMPGSYPVRARYLGTTDFAASVSGPVTLTVATR